MLECIPEDFEFLCRWNGNRWNGNTIKLSEIDRIVIDPYGEMWAHDYREKALIAKTENNTNRNLTFARSSEEFGKLLFAVYSDSVLK